jgi:prevent-host-death family protein
MSAIANYGLEQARIQLPNIVANAHAGIRSIITKHGKPYAAIVPVQELHKPPTAADLASGILAMQGTGRGLWGEHAGQTVAALRDEWGDA